MHQQFCRKEDGIDQLVSNSIIETSPDLSDRSQEIIYATTLMDGRIISIYGPQILKFIKEGVVVMNGTCQLKDGIIGNIEIRTDDKGDNITVSSNLRYTHPADEVSDAEWDAQIRQTELVDTPEEMMETIAELADDFLNKKKDIVNLRRQTRDTVLQQITSSRGQESQE